MNTRYLIHLSTGDGRTQWPKQFLFFHCGSPARRNWQEISLMFGSTIFSAARKFNQLRRWIVGVFTYTTNRRGKQVTGWEGKSSKEEMKPCKKSVIVFTPGNLASEATSMNSRSFYMPKIHIPAESYAFFCLQERFETLEKLTKAQQTTYY